MAKTFTYSVCLLTFPLNSTMISLWFKNPIAEKPGKCAHHTGSGARWGGSGVATLGGKLNKRKFKWVVVIFLKFICGVKGGHCGYSPPQAPVILVAYTVASWIDLCFLSLKIHYYSYYDYNDTCYYCGYFLVTTVNQFSVLNPVFVLPYRFVRPWNCYYWL